MNSGSLDLATLRARFDSGGLSPRALVEDIWRRCNGSTDPAIWIHRLPLAELHEHARRVEKRGPAGQPLYGIPFAIKDNIDLAGAPTSAGCPAYTFTPEKSAPVVERLLAAGAIPIGKTNLDQFATGLVGTRSPYGTPRNPFGAEVIPGGSSSGSAVAVSAGLVSFSLGTDTAGSGRIPAGFNNLVGLKPTRGALSTRGVVPACRSLDCVSVFALNCADASLVMAAAEKFDRDDPFARSRQLRSPWPGVIRVGVPGSDELDFAGDREAEALFDRLLHQIEGLGGQKVGVVFEPFRATAALLYEGPWIAERWSALRDFHAKNAEGMLPITRHIVERGACIGAPEVFEGFYRLAELSRRAAGEWEKMDMLLVPTAPRPFTRAEVEADPIGINSKLGTYTNFVNLLDLSALAIPAGIRSDGIPWGITLIAPTWRETDLLAFGSRLHAAAGVGLGATGFPLREAPPASPIAAADAIRLAVVGAHLSGLPLNPQLTSRGARMVWKGATAPNYRLYALPGMTPRKPGLIRVADGGKAIEVEVWEMTAVEFGLFSAAVPPPLCIGTVTLQTGASVKGFLCESHAIADARDISEFGGWKAYCAACPPGAA